MATCDPVTSPCVNICRLDPATERCVGCLRTLEEIAGWGGYTEDQKRAVLRALAGRRAEDGGARRS